MDEKKSIKVSLSTVICIFIIFVLILIILGMWFYYNNLIENTNNTTITNSDSNIAINNTNADSNVAINNTNNDISSNNSTEVSFKLGNHYVQSNETPLDDGINSTDCSISFLEDNTFTAYIGWGNNISGTYNISGDNIINCTVDNSWGEYSPNQETYAEISFKMNSDTEIEVIAASEYYTIKSTNLNENGNGWILTDEDKDMPLGIEIKKGIKFVLSD